MDFRRSSTSKEKEIRGYNRRPYSFIESRLGSHLDSLETLMPFDRYYNWASSMLNEIPRTKEMSVTRAWLAFIYKNRDVPVMYDFIRLFVFSLHLRYRVRPFDANPNDNFLKQPRFDVVNAGKVLISRLIALEQEMNANGDLAIEIQRRDRHYSKCPKPIYDKTDEPQRFFPLIHISNNTDKNTKEYFATQGIPGFGRHCWYTVAEDKHPYYFPHPPNPRNRKDILGRLADHLGNMEKRKQRPLTERDVERFRLTTRDWWTWRDQNLSMGFEEASPEDKNFQWYRHSTITKGVNCKLDKKHMKKIMDDELKEVTLGYRPIPRCMLRNVLGLDIDDSSFSNVKVSRRHSSSYRLRSPSAAAKRASVSKWLDDLDLSVNQEIPETRDEPFSPGSPFQESTTPCDIKSTPPPCIRRNTTSPCERTKPSPCPRTSTPLPCQRRSTTSSYPRTSTPSPCPRRSTPSPCPRSSTPSPCPRRSTPSPCPRTSTPSPCPVFDTESTVYSKDPAFTREIAERIGDPRGPPEIVNAAISGWLEQLESSFKDLPPAPERTQTSQSPESSPLSQSGFARQSTGFGGTSSPCGTEEGFFGPSEALGSESWGEPIEGTYPDAVESGQDFADEMAAFEAQTCGGWQEKSGGSLDFENAKELSFADQFLLPTTDILVDEEAQDGSNPFGGFDDTDDDWVAPPEIVPCDAQQVVPVRKESETEDRRAGKLFLPQPKKTEDTAELGRISWPDKTHLYDINTDFPDTDRPFDFLDENQLRNVDDMRDSCQEISEDNEKWLNLADIADQIGEKL